MKCLDCGIEIVQTDMTYSNCNTGRAYNGQHTGDIYYCEKCGQHFIEDMLTGRYEHWSY